MNNTSFLLTAEQLTAEIEKKSGQKVTDTVQFLISVFAPLVNEAYSSGFEEGYQKSQSIKM